MKKNMKDDYNEILPIHWYAKNVFLIFLRTSSTFKSHDKQNLDIERKTKVKRG